MLTARVLVWLAVLIGFVAGKACHGSHCPVPGPGEVNSSIDQIHMHYNDRLCLEILLLDCATHTAVGDERVCGNDGRDYADHCYFAHARCQFLHSEGHVLQVAHEGPCHQPTTTTATTTTSAMTTTVNHNQSTVTTDHTLVVIGTARPITTTPDPIYGIIQNVFCQNANSFVCNQDLDLVCGSDGYWYRNSCEFSKERCTNTGLNMVDVSFCSDPST